jgi:hypothetical protein
MRRGVAILALIAAVAAAVLGYGYWFGAMHGAVLVSVVDVSDRNRISDLRPVDLSFLDASGHTLAKAQSLPDSGAIVLTAPPPYACHDIERRAPFSADARKQWDECFERQSRWVPTWIRNARAATIESGACRIDRVPITVSEYPDTWWLWWVPLPHIGGKPYTTFRVAIEITSTQCSTAAAVDPRRDSAPDSRGRAARQSSPQSGSDTASYSTIHRAS